MAEDEDMGTLTKIIVSAGIIVLMIPGLIFEPGPISETLGVASLAAIWGLPLLDES